MLACIKLNYFLYLCYAILVSFIVQYSISNMLGILQDCFIYIFESVLYTWSLYIYIHLLLICSSGYGSSWTTFITWWVVLIAAIFHIKLLVSFLLFETILCAAFVYKDCGLGGIYIYIHGWFESILCFFKLNILLPPTSILKLGQKRNSHLVKQ